MNDINKDYHKENNTQSSSEQFPSELIAMLLKQMPEDMELIESLYQAQDWDKLTFYVHKLHGALCYTPYTNAKKASMDLEKELREKDRSLDKVVELYQIFQTEIKNLIAMKSTE